MAWGNTVKQGQGKSTSQKTGRSRESLSNGTLSASKTVPRHRRLSVDTEKDSEVKRVLTLVRITLATLKWAAT